MPAPDTIPAIPNTWTPYSAPIDSYAELGAASQPVGLGSSKILLAHLNQVQANVLAYGAVADGATTDNTAAIQAAVTAAPAGGVVFVPSQGDYFKVANQVTINKALTVVFRGQLRSTDVTKLIFLVTSSDVTFIFEGGSLRGPGTFNQTAAGGANYGGLAEFRGASVGAPLTNIRVINPRLIDPPWTGIYFRYCDGFEIDGGNSIGGPTSQTGTNHFVFLSFDSINWVIRGFENRGSAGGGYPVQMFCNTQSAVSSSPGVMVGCRNFGTWDKMIYQYIDGAIVVGNWSRNISTGGSKESIRVGGRCRVSDNIVEGGIQVLGPQTGLPDGPGGAAVVNNYIWNYDHVGIQFGPIGIIGAGPLSNCECTGNTIIATTPGGAVTEIYEAIRFSTSAGIDITNIHIGPNTIIGADMTTGGGASANVGAISVQSGGTMSEINIGPQTIIGCGSHGIVIYDARDVVIKGGTFRNIASDSSASLGYGVKFVTSAARIIVDGVKCIDDRGGSSRLAGTVTVGAGTYTPAVYTNNIAIGVAAGGSGLNTGDPFASITRATVSGNAMSSDPLIGQFTIPNGAATPGAVANTAIRSSGVGNYTVIKTTPLNAAAITLQAAAPLWVSTIVARTSFTPQTWNGTTNAGTDAIFAYEIVQ